MRLGAAATMDSLIGVIPAGGRGSRLAPYLGPKELFPIGWQPYSANGEIHRRPKAVSQYVIESIISAGVHRLFIIVGEHKYDILRYFGSGHRYQAHIAYLYQEEPVSMVHAIDLAYPWTRGMRVVFGMPDTIIHPPEAFSTLLEQHRTHPADLTLGLFSTTRPEKFGMVAIDRTDRVITHVDKPHHTSLSLMWGCAIWESTFTDLIHTVRESFARPSELVLGDVIDQAISRRMVVRGHHFVDGFYVDVGTYDEIVEAQTKMQEVLK